MSLNRFAGRVALVTGGNGGIGLAVARMLLEEGARVLIVGRDRDKLAAAEAELGSAHCTSLVADVSRPEDNQHIVATAQQRLGGLDVFIANAGIGLPTWRLVDIPVEKFDEVIAVNLRGVFLGMKYALPALRVCGKGAFVVVSSIAGIKGRGTGNGAYVASKHGELGLVKTAAIENAEYGIRVNAVMPGPTDTAMIRDLAASRARDSGGDGKAAIVQAMPQRRYAHVDEVARLIVFMASDDASFCTGGAYSADGGLVAG